MESEISSSKSEPSGSEDSVDRRRICATTTSNQVKSNQDHHMSHKEADRVELRNHGERSKAYTHCRSIKYNDRGCWKILTCQKCGRKGHPRTRASTRVQLVENCMRVSSALWKISTI